MIPPLSNLLPALFPDPAAGVNSSPPFPSPVPAEGTTPPGTTSPPSGRPEMVEGAAVPSESEAVASRPQESASRRETSSARESVHRDGPREGAEGPTERVSRQVRDGRQQVAKARPSPDLAGRVAPGPALIGLVPRALTTTEALKLSTALASGGLATGSLPVTASADGAVAIAAPLSDGMMARLAVAGGRSLTSASIAQQVTDAMRSLEIGADGDAHFRLNEAKLSVTVERNGSDLLVRLVADDAATRAALGGLIEDVRRALVLAQLVEGEVEVIEHARDELKEDGKDASHDEEAAFEGGETAQAVMEQALRRLIDEGNGTEKGDER
jgi:hypothetical protein